MGEKLPEGASFCGKCGSKVEKKNNKEKSSNSIKEDIETLKERERIMKQVAVLNRKIKMEPSLGKKQLLAEERYRLKQQLL